MNFRYVVSTGIDGDRIWQTVATEFQDIREEISRRVLETGDDQIRQALSALGWTPPKEKEIGCG